jgi:hypothetical protein
MVYQNKARKEAQLMKKGMLLQTVMLLLATLFPASLSFGWSLEKTEFRGDLRLRYQYEKRDSDDTARHRERLRCRFGFVTEPYEKVKVSVRLASGSDDPRSTNQTFQDAFSTKGIHLDEAYLEITPWDDIHINGGKFGKAFTTASDLLWDSDITFEGQVIHLGLPGPAGNFHWSVNGGMFMLDEVKSTGNDPHMFVAQPAFKIELGDAMNIGLTLAYYSFNHIKGSSFEHGSGTNTMKIGAGVLSSEALKYDFDSFNPAATLAFSWVAASGVHYKVNLTGDYVYNTDSEDSGYLMGVKVGHAKLKEPGAWEVYYNLRRLERDSFPDIFPDSDFYGGKTNVTGHEIVLTYAVARSVSLGLDYYLAEMIEGDEDQQSVLQADLVVKF